ncbi:hypothetical protein GQ53DRAFT_24217 [Thozetella sp. PMI_491]|nr:hypothetical protein GQ53DRAFT_24217 [Thozetella sp. PMI_491]
MSPPKATKTMEACYRFPPKCTCWTRMSKPNDAWSGPDEARDWSEFGPKKRTVYTWRCVRTCAPALTRARPCANSRALPTKQCACGHSAIAITKQSCPNCDERRCAYCEITKSTRRPAFV